MTTEHWRQVWDLCEQARQLSREEQPGYVWAHAPDKGTAREVLSLLAEPEASVLPSWNTGSSSDAPGNPSSANELAGARIGRYRIGNLIGRGAGGDVYSAVDAELERRVAIKFLRSDNESGWRAEGFLREARAASALNHPGIVTVHEVMQSEAGLAIVMELVEGRSLRELCATPNSIEDVARWGAQVASALAAAHGSSIIHRDIKPENIVLRPDGLAKLLDFGLAQRGGLADGRKSQLVGTLRYMSPEQGAGRELTPASDVFSFGVVVYEVIAGRHPFPASGLEAVLQAISECRPEPISRRRRDVPKPLEVLILEMLSKAPEARPGATEVARRLEPFARPVTGHKGFFGAGLAAAALAIAAAVWTVRQREPEAIAPLAAVPLTTTAGFDSWPDISPDGKSVVYGWGASPNAFTHLYIKDFDQDASVLLIESKPGVRIGHPRWSSDGHSIFYKRTVPNWGGEAIWSVTRDGTDQRPVTALKSAELSSGIEVSADGSRILFGDQASQNQWPYKLYSLDLRSGQKTQLSAPEQGWGDWDPRYSPDGKQIAFKRVQHPGDDQIYLMPSTGGLPRQLTMPRQSIYGHVWTPEGRLLFAAQFRSVIHGLWMISPAGNSQPSPIFESGFDATMPVANRERIVWVNLVNDYNIYSVPLAGGTPVKRIASPLLDSMPSLSSDGRLAFVSRRSGSPEIWISRQDGGGAARVTNLKGDLSRPHWSPNGAGIVFSMRHRGVSKVYVMRCAAGTLTCETPETFVEGSRPTWTADGKSFYFEAPETGEIRKMPLSGGQAVLVIPGLEAIVSRDGQWLYFSRMTNASGGFFRIGVDKDGNTRGTEELVLQLKANSAEFHNWTVAGDEILFWESNVESKFSGLRAYNVKTKRLRTVIQTPAAAYPAVSPDGKTVWYAQPDSAGATLMTAERRR